MRKPESLCDFIAGMGGIAAYSPALQRTTPEGRDLLAIDAHLWHRAAPFRRKLIHTDGKGRSMDDVALAAWEHGYFPSHRTRPDLHDLHAAIAGELAGKPVYTLEDQMQALDAEIDIEREAIMAEAAGLDEAPVAVYYEKTWENRKGQPGVSYYAKVIHPAKRKPIFHTVFRTPAEREAAVSAFLSQHAPADAGCPF